MDKIVCIGKNYLEHIKELGDKLNEKPVLFIKPPSVLKTASSNREVISCVLPQGVGDIHYETEVVLKIGKSGFKIKESAALQHIDSVSIGLDMTLRALQSELKKNGHPWTTSKVFPCSAIVGPFIPVKNFGAFESTEFSLSLNNQVKQKAVLKDMIYSWAWCVAYISEFFELCPGDLIYTGTPHGVGPVKLNDTGHLKYGPIEYSVKWSSYV